jgi:SAM-dependent methyltransferase
MGSGDPPDHCLCAPPTPKLIMPEGADTRTTPGRYEPSAYWETLLSKSFDTSGVAYAYLAVSFNESLYRAERDQVRRAFARWKPSEPIGCALDIGCGTGIWIEFWRRLGVTSITGVDLTETSIVRLRQRGIDAALIRADIGDPNVDLGGPFDVISAMSVLLHIVNPDRFAAAVANLARHLAPDGRMFLIEPVIVDGWWGGEFGPEANSRARTLEAWTSEIERHDLELLDIRPVTFLLANPIDANTERAFRYWLRYWNYVLRYVGRRERAGVVAGRILELLDRPLRRRLRPGPSAKLLVVGHKRT